MDIEESDIGTSLNKRDNEIIINIKLEIKDYSRGRNEFKIRVYWPESLGKYLGENFMT